MKDTPTWVEKFRHRRPKLGSSWEYIRCSDYFSSSLSRGQAFDPKVGDIALVVDVNGSPNTEHVFLLRSADGSVRAWGYGWFGHARAAWRQVRAKPTRKDKVILVQVALALANKELHYDM